MAVFYWCSDFPVNKHNVRPSGYEYLNIIEETTGEMSYKEVVEEMIETPMCTRRHSNHPGGKHQERGGVTRTQRCEAHHPRSHTLLCVVEHALQGSDGVGEAGVAPQDGAWWGPRGPGAERHLASLAEDGGHDER